MMRTMTMDPCCTREGCRGCAYPCPETNDQHDDEFDPGLEVWVCRACDRESPNLGAGDTRVRG